jgi:site-specific recombinase
MRTLTRCSPRGYSVTFRGIARGAVSAHIAVSTFLSVVLILLALALQNILLSFEILLYRRLHTRQPVPIEGLGLLQH